MPKTLHRPLWQPSQSDASPMTLGIAKRPRPGGMDGTGLNWTAPDRPRPGPYCSEQTPVALGCAKTHLTPKGNGAVAWQTQIPPSMTGLSASPNAPSANWQSIPPTSPGQPIRRRSNPGAVRARGFSAFSGFIDRTGLETEPTSSRLSLLRTNALALRAHLSRHDKQPFFVNFPRLYGPDAPPP